MQTIRIFSLTPETADVCAIRLVGGYDSQRKHHPAINLSNFESTTIFDKIEDYHEAKHKSSVSKFEKQVICELVRAEDLVFDGVRYVFDVRNFSDPESLKFVTLDVMAQIIG